MSRYRYPARAHVASGLMLLLLAVLALGQESGRIPLNSERIEARYGSYAIEVLASDAAIRESNLFSRHDGTNVTRTFAVVSYAQPTLPEYNEEHEAIVAGGSIGAVFASRGWRVDKHNRSYAELEASDKLASMMGISPGIDLAVHIYVLEVVKDDKTFEYCTIAEVHHPDYLTLSDLERIYGSIPELSTVQAERAEGLLDFTRERMQR